MRKIELTELMESLFINSSCNPFHGVAHSWGIKCFDGHGLDGGDCYGIVFCACGMVKACRTLGG